MVELGASDRERLNLPAKLKGGMVVTAVDPTSPAAEAHLQKDDVIYRAQHSEVVNENDLRSAVGNREHTVLNVFRKGRPFGVVIHKPWAASDVTRAVP
jgi:S1-C subfamily serine protease